MYLQRSWNKAIINNWKSQLRQRDSHERASGNPGVVHAAVIPCVGTALIVLCGNQRPDSLLVRLLSLKGLVFVGLISYSLYLWHWPVFVFAKHYLLRPLQTEEAVLLILISVLLAWLSWRFIEKPMRGVGGLLSTKQVFRYSGSTIAGLVVVGVTFDATHGLPGRLPERVQQLASFADDKP